MSAEAIVLLRQALQPGGDRSKQVAAIERLREIRVRNRLPAGTSPAEQLGNGSK